MAEEESGNNNTLTEPLLDEDNKNSESEEPLLPNLTNKKDVIEASTSPSTDDPEENNRGSPLPLPASSDRGIVQSPSYRDWPFSVLFHLQFLTVSGLGIYYFNKLFDGGNDFDDNPNVDVDLNLSRILYPVLVSAATAIGLILLAFIILTQLGKAFITCSVWTSAILSLAIGLVALAAGQVIVGVFSLFSALIGVCYAIRVRTRIPFAAANLDAGASSIRANFGIALVAFLVTSLLSVWMTLWSSSLLGVMGIHDICDEEDGGTVCDVEIDNGGWVLPWTFFLFWTQQVFKNIIHTTVAGLVGTWFFDPESATSFCSQAVTSSLIRSLTYSFGSICLGSLVVAIVQTLDWMVNTLRRERDGGGQQSPAVGLLLCCLDCLLSMLQGALEYINKYAFVYVGVYGYPFMTSGKKVMTLFKERGWTVIINDHLIANALGLMCFVVALLSGIVPLVFIDDDLRVPVFIIGFFVALLLSMTIMSIIDSAVTTILVCFAEDPESFDRNHNEHSRDMKEAWSNVYQITF